MQVAAAQTKESQPFAKVYEVITSLIAPLGYEVVHLELQTHRQKVLRLFIDHLKTDAGGIGVEDCARVSRALDEPMETMPELDALFHGATYELEVSSPGVDRPLRLLRDYERFVGREIRVHTFRALTAEELGNADHQAKNSKQKNFVGGLLGLERPSGDDLSAENFVRLELSADGSATLGKKKQKTNAAASAAATELAKRVIRIPFALISKANLEPDFDLEGLEE